MSDRDLLREALFVRADYLDRLGKHEEASALRAKNLDHLAENVGDVRLAGSSDASHESQDFPLSAESQTRRLVFGADHFIRDGYVSADNGRKSFVRRALGPKTLKILVRTGGTVDLKEASGGIQVEITEPDDDPTVYTLSTIDPINLPPEDDVL